MISLLDIRSIKKNMGIIDRSFAGRMLGLHDSAREYGFDNLDLVYLMLAEDMRTAEKTGGNTVIQKYGNYVYNLNIMLNFLAMGGPNPGQIIRVMNASAAPISILEAKAYDHGHTFSRVERLVRELYLQKLREQVQTEKKTISKVQSHSLVMQEQHLDSEARQSSFYVLRHRDLIQSEKNDMVRETQVSEDGKVPEERLLVYKENEALQSDSVFKIIKTEIQTDVRVSKLPNTNTENAKSQKNRILNIKLGESRRFDRENGNPAAFDIKSKAEGAKKRHALKDGEDTEETVRTSGKSETEETQIFNKQHKTYEIGTFARRHFNISKDIVTARGNIKSETEESQILNKQHSTYEEYTLARRYYVIPVDALEAQRDVKAGRNNAGQLRLPGRIRLQRISVQAKDWHEKAQQGSFITTIQAENEAIEAEKQYFVQMAYGRLGETGRQAAAIAGIMLQRILEGFGVVSAMSDTRQNDIPASDYSLDLAYPETQTELSDLAKRGEIISGTKYGDENYRYVKTPERYEIRDNNIYTASGTIQTGNSISNTSILAMHRLGKPGEAGMQAMVFAGDRIQKLLMQYQRASQKRMAQEMKAAIQIDPLGVIDAEPIGTLAIEPIDPIEAETVDDTVPRQAEIAYYVQETPGMPPKTMEKQEIRHNTILTEVKTHTWRDSQALPVTLETLYKSLEVIRQVLGLKIMGTDRFEDREIRHFYKGAFERSLTALGMQKLALEVEKQHIIRTIESIGDFFEHFHKASETEVGAGPWSLAAIEKRQPEDKQQMLLIQNTRNLLSINVIRDHNSMFIKTIVQNVVKRARGTLGRFFEYNEPAESPMHHGVIKGNGSNNRFLQQMLAEPMEAVETIRTPLIHEGTDEETYRIQNSTGGTKGKTLDTIAKTLVNSLHSYERTLEQLAGEEETLYSHSSQLTQARRTVHSKSVAFRQQRAQIKRLLTFVGRFQPDMTTDNALFAGMTLAEQKLQNGSMSEHAADAETELTFRYTSNPSEENHKAAKPKEPADITFTTEMDPSEIKVLNETVEETIIQDKPGNVESVPDLAKLADQVYKRLEDRLRIERQRRGLFR